MLLYVLQQPVRWLITTGTIQHKIFQLTIYTAHSIELNNLYPWHQYFTTTYLIASLYRICHCRVHASITEFNRPIFTLSKNASQEVRQIDFQSKALTTQARPNKFFNKRSQMNWQPFYLIYLAAKWSGPQFSFVQFVNHKKSNLITDFFTSSSDCLPLREGSNVSHCHSFHCWAFSFNFP